MDQPIVLAEHVGLAGVDAGLGDHRGDIDPSVIGVGQKQRDHDCAPRQSGKHITQVRKVLLAERDSHVERRTQPARAFGDRMRRRRGPRVRAAVCRQDECRAGLGGSEPSHEACSPHSVFDKPAQRPLRGSAPSTGLAVHGAHPIDG